jgi:hypothetical protein
MNWADENWIKIYIRDTGNWISLGWQAQSVFLLSMRKCDRFGRIPTGSKHARGLAGILSVPLDVVEQALPLLLDEGTGCMRVSGDHIEIVNFADAQSSRSSVAKRAREYRDREREKYQNVTKCDEIVTKCDETVTQNVTPSQTVTDRHDQIRSDQIRSDRNSDHPSRNVTARPRRVQSPAFEEFWSAYPKHVGKVKALEKWPGDEHLEAILSALGWQKKSSQWVRDGGQYVPNPATWLHQQRWKDEKPSADKQPTLLDRPPAKPVVKPFARKEAWPEYPREENEPNQVLDLVDRLAIEKSEKEMGKS